MKFQQDQYTSTRKILNTFPALPFVDREQLPSSTGVYLVFNGVEEIVYVGKTKNFHARWISHHKKGEIFKNYNKLNIIITYSILSNSEIDFAEAWLINKYMPKLNVNIPTIFKEGTIVECNTTINNDKNAQEIREWHESKDISSSNIPKIIKKYIYLKSKCQCTVCGNIVEESKIRMTRFNDGSENKIDNLALVCTKCTSRMHSSTTLAEFKIKQQERLYRDMNKLKSFMEFYFENGGVALESCELFLKENEISLYHER